jgi:predicted permease
MADLASALRLLRKTPGFTLIAVFVVGIGIGANTAVFTMVNELVLRPRSGRADALVGVYSHDRTRPDSYRMFSYPNYVDVRERSDLFEGLLAQTFTMVGTPDGDGTRQMLAAVVSANYFDTIGVRLAAGRPFTADEDRPGARPVAIVTHARWMREGGDPALLGRTIRLNGEDYRVVGVTPEGFTGTMALLSADVYLPLGRFDSVVSDRFKNNGRGLGDRANEGLVLAGLVRDGLTDDVVAARLDVLSRQLAAEHPAENANQLLTASPLPRLGGGPTPQTNAPLTALTSLLLGLSGVVLVIACLNVANMLLARATARRREVALRLALGAGRARVIRQLLTESLLLSALGAGVGLLLSLWTTRALAASIGSALPFTLSFRTTPDAAILAATAGLAAISAVAFGLWPALRLSRRDLVADLSGRDGGAPATARRFSARNVMAIGQVALSLALLTAGGIFARTAQQAASTTPGYDYDRLLLASVDTTLARLDDGRRRATYAGILDRLRTTPGVERVTMASTLPFGDSIDSATLEAVGDGGRAPVRARAYRIVGADYFATLGLRMVRGREFTRAEELSAEAPRVAIVDEAFARQLFDGRDPIGQLIRVARSNDSSSGPGEPMEIVGVAAPLREELLDRAPVPHVYVPFGREGRAGMHVLVRLTPGRDAAAALEDVRVALRSVEPDLPVLALATLQGFHDRSSELWALRLGARVFSGLAVVALVIAAIGVYGVKSYVVAQRTREIGIRMALGARPRDVLRLVLREGVLLTGAGVAIGVPLAALVAGALRSVFVDVGGFDGVVVGVSTAILVVAATVAAAVPARRATRVQPVIALRTE